jgi:dolichol kinase
MSQFVREPKVVASGRRHETGALVARAIPIDSGSVLPPFAWQIAVSNWWRVMSARLSPQEWRRRLIHMAPGILAGGLPLLPHTDPLGWYSQAFLVVAITSAAAFAIFHARLFERRGQAPGWPISVISYAVISLGLFLAFPAQTEIGIAVTAIIAFGDGSATLIGKLFRGPKLPWNRAKTWSGLLGCLVCSVPMATLYYWMESNPRVSIGIACACVVPAGLVAAIVESLPVRLNDNIRVGASAGLTILLTHAMFVGY